MTDETLKDISKKIDYLVLMAASIVVKGLRPNEAIPVLASFGLDRNAIARVVGTTPLTVSVRLSEAKARRAGARRKPPRKSRH